MLACNTSIMHLNLAYTTLSSAGVCVSVCVCGGGHTHHSPVQVCVGVGVCGGGAHTPLTSAGMCVGQMGGAWGQWKV